MPIILANPRGFCAGVDRAIAIVEQALESFGQPIYVKHEVVHNQFVVDNLKAKGAIFVEDISSVPEGATLIFSAHGVSPSIRAKARERACQVFDATCPLVTKVHLEVNRYSRLAYECILIGHAGHPEVEGTLGYYDNPEGGIYLIENEDEVKDLSIKNPERLAYVTQTTLSIDDTQRIVSALQKRFPLMQGPRKDDICYATQNRQEAVKKLVEQCDVVLVVGSATSSNSQRLKEVAEHSGKPAYLINSVLDIKVKWLSEKKIVGVTAGASTPELLVKELIDYLQNFYNETVQELEGQSENITFSLPPQLRKRNNP